MEKDGVDAENNGNGDLSAGVQCECEASAGWSLISNRWTTIDFSLIKITQQWEKLETIGASSDASL